jgi:hypothetical protein
LGKGKEQVDDMKHKKVKMWNGGAIKSGKQWHISIGATSVRQALELIEKAGFGYTGALHFKNYFSPMWGNDMNGIEPEIGLWGKLDDNRHLDNPMDRLV